MYILISLVRHDTYCIAKSHSTSFARHTRRPSHKHTHASNNNRVRLLRNVSRQAKTFCCWFGRNIQPSLFICPPTIFSPLLCNQGFVYFHVQQETRQRAEPIYLPVVSFRGCWCVTGRSALETMLTKADTVVCGFSSATARILSVAKPQHKMRPCFLITVECCRGWNPRSCNISTRLECCDASHSVLSYKRYVWTNPKIKFRAKNGSQNQLLSI